MIVLFFTVWNQYYFCLAKKQKNLQNNLLRFSLERFFFFRNWVRHKTRPPWAGPGTPPSESQITLNMGPVLRMGAPLYIWRG